MPSRDDILEALTHHAETRANQPNIKDELDRRIDQLLDQLLALPA